MALNEDTTLYNKAFEKNCNCNSATLLATLRTIDSMWANQNNKKMPLRQAGALYDKFEGFVSDLIK
jgi:DNA recombination protein RmuC